MSENLVPIIPENVPQPPQFSDAEFMRETLAALEAAHEIIRDSMERHGLYPDTGSYYQITSAIGKARYHLNLGPNARGLG